MMYQIGIDIGGTNMKIGLLNEALEIVQRTSIPFPHTDAEDMVARLHKEVCALMQLQGIDTLEAVGVIVPGSISRDESTVIDAHNLNFHNVPLKALMEQAFSPIPVFLANDADGAALAELACGAFAGHDSGVLLTLGTGLGGGIILNRKLFRGGMNQGCELGHAYLVDGGEHCTCGNDGCMEAYVSATALAREGKKAMLANPDSLLAKQSGGDENKVDARLVTDCAKAGDEVALKVFMAYVGHLGSTCASFFNILDPEVLAIGGGLCGAGEFLFAPLRAEIDKKCFYHSHGAVVPAAAGNDAGMIGAAILHRYAK